jgi:hypothetical protein
MRDNPVRLAAHVEPIEPPFAGFVMLYRVVMVYTLSEDILIVKVKFNYFFVLTIFKRGSPPV